MQFSEYQKAARRTDRIKSLAENERLLVALLGLAGESGQLLSEFKNRALHRDSKEVFAGAVREELGDLLWYVSNIADQFGLSLDDIAFDNLVKTENRWPGYENGSTAPLYDDRFPTAERFPRKAKLRFKEIESGGSRKLEITFEDGTRAGHLLTDNAYVQDGYRFHDVFHLSYLAVLGWSPVMRKLWDVKRRSNVAVDEIEDGGRAQVIEEGIAALVFAEAHQHALFATSETVDTNILRVVKRMTAHLEVSTRSYREWQHAILAGYKVFRAMQANGGGTVSYDMVSKTIVFEG